MFLLFISFFPFSISSFYWFFLKVLFLIDFSLPFWKFFFFFLLCPLITSDLLWYFHYFFPRAAQFILLIDVSRFFSISPHSTAYYLSTQPQRTLRHCTWLDYLISLIHFQLLLISRRFPLELMMLIKNHWPQTDLAILLRFWLWPSLSAPCFLQPVHIHFSCYIAFSVILESPTPLFVFLERI